MSLLTLAIQTPDPATVLFYLFAGIAAASAISLVASRDVVRMAVSLLFTLAGVAGLYFTLEAEFLAAVQLVVYAGGTLILIVFGVMLTSRAPFLRMTPKRAEVVVALAIAAVLFTVIAAGLHVAIGGGAFAGKAMPAGEPYPMVKLGQSLLGDYLIPFELVSVLLLAVMIGAAYLAKARRQP